MSTDVFLSHTQKNNPKTNNKNVPLNNLSANFKSFSETIDHLWSGLYNTAISSFYSPPRCLVRNILDFQK